MKVKIIFFLILVQFYACSNHSSGPDVSGIKLEIPIERFDRDFFSMDTIALEKSLPNLELKYKTIFPVFLSNVLGVNPAMPDTGIRRFIQLNHFVFDTANKIFQNTGSVQKEFEEAFRYVKYYFPEYKIPRVITIVGPMDALAQTAGGDPTPDFIGPDFLGISLQFYLGKDFSLYKDDYFINGIAPEYRSRRFDKKYLVADAMKLITDDLFPEKTQGKGLIEQMIEKGKQWWLLDKFLPSTPDSVKTGFTKDQLEWCDKNEGLIWQTILTNHKDIFTTDPLVIQNYIGEAPFTQNMGPGSPGNIGQWVGWQIVKMYAEKNSTQNINEIMKTEAKKILEGAKYKPK